MLKHTVVCIAVLCLSILSFAIQAQEIKEHKVGLVLSGGGAKGFAHIGVLKVIDSLGIKIDCVPGRLNQVSVFIKRSGLFYGQCSEICGINHGFMPIKVAGINKDQYINYIYNKQKLLFFD